MMAFWSYLYAIAAAQAVLLSLVLWQAKRNQIANRVLSIWVLLIGIDLGAKAIHIHAPSTEFLRWYGITLFFKFSYAPLFFVYLKLMTSQQNFSLKYAKHFIVFAAIMLFNMNLFVSSDSDIRQLFQQLGTADAPARFIWFDVFLYVYSIAYLIAAFRELVIFRKQLANQRSDIQHIDLSWLMVMSICQALIWLVAILHWMFGMSLISHWAIYGAVSGWIFIIGYLSLQQSQIPRIEPLTESQHHSSVKHSAVDSHDNRNEMDNRSELDSRIELDSPKDLDCRKELDSRVPQVIEKINHLMHEQQLFTKPALTIIELAKKSGYPEYLVSQALNHQLGLTFNDYINELRVEAVAKALISPGNQLSILDLAYQYGFTAKSTFNSAFKRHFGLTPSAYRKANTPQD